MGSEYSPWLRLGMRKDFPEEELNVIFGNSIYMVKMMLLVQMGMEWGVGTI